MRFSWRITLFTACVLLGAAYHATDAAPFVFEAGSLIDDISDKSDFGEFCHGTGASDAQRALQATLQARTSFSSGSADSLQPVRRLAFGSCNMQHNPQPAWHSMFALSGANANAVFNHELLAKGGAIFTNRSNEYGRRRATGGSGLYPEGMASTDVLDYMLHRSTASAAATAAVKATDAGLNHRQTVRSILSAMTPAPPSLEAAERAGPAAVGSGADKGPPLDAFVWLGDAVYLDKEQSGVSGLRATPPAVMQRTWQRQHARAGYCALRATFPVLGVWDDHDYGTNNGDATYADKDPAQGLLLDFLDVPAPAGVQAAQRAASAGAAQRLKQQGGAVGATADAAAEWASAELAAQWRRARAVKGTYSAQSWGPPGRRTKLILLDIRYEMDMDADDILGPAQWEWFARELDLAFGLPASPLAGAGADAAPADAVEPPADIVLIGFGIQAVSFGKPFVEGWRMFPRSRARLFQLISDRYAPFLAATAAPAATSSGSPAGEVVERAVLPAWVQDVTASPAADATQVPLSYIPDRSAAAAVAESLAAAPPAAPVSPAAATAARGRTPPAVAFVSGDIHLAELSHTETLFTTPLARAPGSTAAAAGPRKAVAWAAPWFEATTSGMTHAWGFAGALGHPTESRMYAFASAVLPPIMNSPLTMYTPQMPHRSPPLARAVTSAAAAAAEQLYSAGATVLAAALAAGPADVPVAATDYPRGTAASKLSVLVGAAQSAGARAVTDLPLTVLQQLAVWACSEATDAGNEVKQWMEDHPKQYMGRNYATFDILWGDDEGDSTATNSGNSAAAAAATAAAAGAGGADAATKADRERARARAGPGGRRVSLPAGVPPLRCPLQRSAALAAAGNPAEPLLIVAVREVSTADPVSIAALPFSDLRPRVLGLFDAPAKSSTAGGSSTVSAGEKGVKGAALLAGASALMSPLTAGGLASAAVVVAEIALEERTARMIQPMKLPAETLVKWVALALLLLVLYGVYRCCRWCCCRGNRSSTNEAGGAPVKAGDARAWDGADKNKDKTTKPVRVAAKAD